METKQLLWDIGARLFKARKEKGYTQENLADLTGLTEQTISYAENGIKVLRLENVIKICKALDISADYLLFGTEKHSALSISKEDFEKLSPEQREHIKLILDSCVKLCNPKE